MISFFGSGARAQGILAQIACPRTIFRAPDIDKPRWLRLPPLLRARWPVKSRRRAAGGMISASVADYNRRFGAVSWQTRDRPRRSAFTSHVGVVAQSYHGSPFKLGTSMGSVSVRQHRPRETPV